MASSRIRRIYVGLTEADLLQRKADTLKQIDLRKQGKPFSGVSAAGKSFNRSLVTLEDLYTEMEEILFALQKIDPDTYGKRVTTTYTDFSRTEEP